MVQVQRSVAVAEQIKQQKAEAELEAGQLAGQVERQQLRIRQLIEEQVGHSALSGVFSL